MSQPEEWHLAPRGGLLALHVKGLAEKRPSVLRGDVVHSKYPGSKKTYEGRAAQIEMEDVLLELSYEFVRGYIRTRIVGAKDAFRIRG